MRRFHISIGVLFLSISHAWAAATLENPVPGALKSGVGVISGWVCDADELEVSFDGGARLFIPYGSERLDTDGVCGDTDNGFGLLWNYNELGDGPHTVTLYVDGILTTHVNFNVRTLGTNFLRGVTGQGIITLSDGKRVNVQWEETTQGFTITGYTPSGTTGDPPPTDPGGGGSSGAEQQLRELIGTWDFRVTLTNLEPLTLTYRIERIERTGGVLFAVGPNPFGRSDLVIVRIEDLLDTPISYDFAMLYVEDLTDGSFWCVTYVFNQSGHTITGEVAVTTASGPDIATCSDEIIIAGTFTGTRR